MEIYGNSWRLVEILKASFVVFGIGRGGVKTMRREGFCVLVIPYPV
jgi:hypothetical protein